MYQSDPVSSNAVILHGCFSGMSLILVKRQAFGFNEMLTKARENRRYIETSSNIMNKGYQINCNYIPSMPY